MLTWKRNVARQEHTRGEDTGKALSYGCILRCSSAFSGLFLLSGGTSLWIKLLVILSFLLPLYFLYRRINDPENLRWEDGARGEILVGNELEKLHREDFHVFHDYYSEGRGNVDHFLVGEPGIFVMETKAWKGEVTVENGRFLVDGRPKTEKDPIKQVGGEAKDIFTLIRESTGMNPFVRPVLCFSRADLLHYKAVRGVEITSVGSLNRTIMQLGQRTPDKDRLSPSQVRIASQRLQNRLGESPAAEPGFPPDEPGRVERVLNSGGFFIALYFLVTLAVSVILAGQTAQSLENIAALYRFIASVWAYYL